MSNRVYPRTVWVLHEKFHPMQVEIKFKLSEDKDQSLSGRSYSTSEMYDSKEECIASGRRKIDRMLARIHDQMTTARERIAAIDKAEGK